MAETLRYDRVPNGLTGRDRFPNERMVDFCAKDTGASPGAHDDVRAIEQRYLEGMRGRAAIPEHVAQNGAASSGRVDEVRGIMHCVADEAMKSGQVTLGTDIFRGIDVYNQAWFSALGRR